MSSSNHQFSGDMLVFSGEYVPNISGLCHGFFGYTISSLRITMFASFWCLQDLMLFFFNFTNPQNPSCSMQVVYPSLPKCTFPHVQNLINQNINNCSQCVVRLTNNENSWGTPSHPSHPPQKKKKKRPR